MSSIAIGESPCARRLTVLGRGAGWFGASGAVVGGIAGTIDWPVVGTFFAAVEGAAAGVVPGVVVGLALLALSRWTRSRPAARCLSATWAAAVSTCGAVTHLGPLDLPIAVTVGLILAATALGAAFAPIVMFGLAPFASEPTAAERLRRRIQRVMLGGMGAGATLGAITGLVLGLFSYAPTSPVAAVEGAVLGIVNGTVLASGVSGVVVFPGLRARR